MSQNRYVLLGDSDVMRVVKSDIDAAARSDAKVLLTGETGVGKEVVARAIHQRTRRAAAPFVTINCAGVPDSLLESEFFGHARGSFTGAVRDNPGLLRRAHTGTVFLDEVGEMSLRMQALLLRFLETGEIQTVGAGSMLSHVDVRVITATNRDLLASVGSREFREDLFYRLNVFHIRIPPLRERRDDVATLIDYYAGVFAAQHARPAMTFTPEAIAALTAYDWPGNIRELRNVIERLVLRLNLEVVDAASLPAELKAASTMQAVETAAAGVSLLSHAERVEGLLQRMLAHKESFWTTAYPAFMSRNITRDDLRYMVRHGLEQTHGSYRALVGLFNMGPDDYKRFLGFLKQHECQLPFQRFRVINASQRERQPGRAVG